jgi:hypothetical protein
MTTYDDLRARDGEAAERLLRVALPAQQAAGWDLSGLVRRAEAELHPAYDAGRVGEASFRPALLGAVRRQFDPDAANEPETPLSRAWAGLSPEAQGALWAEVEHGPASETARAELLGALAEEHRAEAQRHVCRTTRRDLPGFLGADLHHGETARVSAHLQCCRRCALVWRQLDRARTAPADLVAPLVLGAAAAAYRADLPVPVVAAGPSTLSVASAAVVAAAAAVGSTVGSAAGSAASRAAHVWGGARASVDAQLVRGLVGSAAALALVAGLVWAGASGRLGGTPGDVAEAAPAQPTATAAREAGRRHGAARGTPLARATTGSGDATGRPSGRPSTQPTRSPRPTRPTRPPVTTPTLPTLPTQATTATVETAADAVAPTAPETTGATVAAAATPTAAPTSLDLGLLAVDWSAPEQPARLALRVPLLASLLQQDATCPVLALPLAPVTPGAPHRAQDPGSSCMTDLWPSAD